MATRMQQRRGTATQWTTANPILNAGEIGWESDTNKFKIGDGVNHWADLTYFSDNAVLTDLIDGAPALLDTLNEIAAAIGDDPSFFTTVATNLSNHEADTTNIHGIADTSLLATVDGTQTLENKTLINPVVTYRELTQPSITMLFQNGAHVYALKKSDGTYHIGPNGQNEWFGSYDSPVINLDGYPDTVGVRVLNSLWNQIFNGTIEGAASAGYISYDDGSNDYTVSPIELYRLDGVTSNIQTQLNSKASTANLTDHAAETSTHGVSGSIVGTNNTQTLTNKTLTNPTITVYEISSPASVTLGGNGGAFYAFRKADGTSYIGPNGQNEWYSAGDTELMSNIPLATQVRVLNSMWNSIGTFSFAAAEAGGYLVNNAEVATTTTVSNIEIKNLDGVTSNIQDQLDAKVSSSELAELAQDAVGNSVGTGLTYTDSTGAIAVDTTTIATQQYVDGAVSNATVDQTALAGYGIAWNLNTEQFDVDTTEIPELTGATFTGPIATSDTTASSSTTTGALKSAGGLGVAGDAYIGGDLIISGDFTVSGTTTTVDTANLNVTDAMIYMGDGNNANLLDLGIVSAFDDGTYQHTGLVRDASAGTWKLFKGVTDEPTTTINFGQGSLDDLAVGGLTASSLTVGSVSNTEIGYLDGVTSAIQTQIDGKSPTAGNTSLVTLGTVTTGTWSADTIALNKGGTGATTQAGAANAILPSQASANGKYLTSDGTNVSWGTVSSYTAPTIGSTSIASGSTVTTIADLTLSGATLTGSLTAGGATGTSGQVLASTGSGVQWTTPAAGAAFSELMLIGA